MSGATGEFDPRTHHVVPPRAFTDFQIGEVFSLPSRTVTDANFAAFQVVSGDNHPIHYDVEYCRRQGHPGLTRPRPAGPVLQRRRRRPAPPCDG